MSWNLKLLEPDKNKIRVKDQNKLFNLHLLASMSIDDLDIVSNNLLILAQVFSTGDRYSKLKINVNYLSNDKIFSTLVDRESR